MTEEQVIEELLTHYFESDTFFSIHKPNYGLSNTTRIVEKDNRKYILRVYDYNKEYKQVLYEHEVLKQLNHRSLSFRIPKLCCSLNNETHVTLSNTKVGALFDFIEGVNEFPKETNQIQLVGKTIAELVKEMENITPPNSPPNHVPNYDFYKRHPLVTEESINGFILNPPFFIESSNLEIFKKELGKFRELASSMHSLPFQMIHGDLILENILFNQSRVSGILDFEFASPDLRVMDVAIHMNQYLNPSDLEGSVVRLQHLLYGFGSVSKLLKEEVEIIPQLMLLRSLSLFIYWYSRYLEGTTELQILQKRFKNFLIMKQILVEIGDEIRQIGVKQVCV